MSVGLSRLVALDVELDEEQEVGGEDELTEEPSSPSATASLSRGELAGVVDPDEVQTDVSDELCDLKLGDVFLPEDGLSEDGKEVIVVHESVNDGVRGGAVPLRGDSPLQADPAKDECGWVVVDVQEDEGFLLEHQEESIEKFVVFAEVEQVEAEVVRSMLVLQVSVTNDGIDTSVRKHLVGFVEHVKDIGQRSDRQYEVVESDDPLEVKRFAVPHQVLDAINDDEVEDASDGRELPRGEGSDSRDPGELTYVRG